MGSSDALPIINHNSPNANLFSNIDAVTPGVFMFARCFATAWFIFTIWYKIPLQSAQMFDFLHIFPIIPHMFRDISNKSPMQFDGFSTLHKNL